MHGFQTVGFKSRAPLYRRSIHINISFNELEILRRLYFAFFFDTRCQALTALDTELARLAFENKALPLCS